MKNIKLIIHDWDDVVTNSFEAYSKFYFDFAKYFNLPEPTIEGLKKFWGKTISQIAHGQWRNLSEEKITEMVRDFIHGQEQNAVRPYEVKVFSRVIESFEKLSKVYSLAILSSGYKPRLLEVYKNQIHPEFIYHKAILAPPDLKVHKPNPRVFDEVLSALGEPEILNEEIIYVGDSLIDFETAKNRGIDFYAVITGVHSKQDFINAGLRNQNIFDNFPNLADFLVNI